MRSGCPEVIRSERWRSTCARASAPALPAQPAQEARAVRRTRSVAMLILSVKGESPFAASIARRRGIPGPPGVSPPADVSHTWRMAKRARTLPPSEIVARLSAIYGEPVWRPHGDPMTELVLTILSQNTSDTNSGRAFMRLKQRFPTWEAMTEAPPDELESAIAVGGLARQKAPRIQAALRAVREARGE